MATFDALAAGWQKAPLEIVDIVCEYLPRYKFENSYIAKTPVKYATRIGAITVNFVSSETFFGDPAFDRFERPTWDTIDDVTYFSNDSTACFAFNGLTVDLCHRNDGSLEMWHLKLDDNMRLIIHYRAQDGSSSVVVHLLTDKIRAYSCLIEEKEWGNRPTFKDGVLSIGRKLCKFVCTRRGDKWPSYSEFVFLPDLIEFWPTCHTPGFLPHGSNLWDYLGR